VSREDARHALQLVLRLPLRLQPTELLVPAALEAALRQGLTVYDALYLVLADLLDATLVTADRRLAAVSARTELVA
jgi:predicted nucleic acid-binding protein